MTLLDRAGGSLWYDVTDLTPPWVEDPPTILFHHGVGITADTWNEWLPPLADRYRLVRLDMRGCGRSTVPPPGFPWALDQLVDDALAVAAAAGARRVHWVGESIGGTIGLRAAARHPEALLSLTCCSTSHRGATIERVKEWRAFIEARGMAAWSAMMMEHRLRPEHVPAAAYAWFEAEQARASAQTTLDLADLLIGTDLTPALPSIAVPTLLLAPGESPFVPLSVMQEIHRLLSDSELHAFPGVRHAIAFSHGPTCARALRDFLDRRAPA